MKLLVGDVLRRAALATPSCPAAVLGDRALTFAELDAQANRLAHVLTGLGVHHGDRVAWWGTTSLDVLPLYGALARIGAALAPVNGLLSPSEAAPVLALSRPSLFVVDGALAGVADELGEGVGLDVERIVRLGPGPGASLELNEAATEAQPVEVDDPGLREDDAHIVFFTSGSTGRQKGVVVSHRASVLRAFPSTIPASEGPTVCMFPLFHMAGWSIALGCWARRIPVVLVERAEPEQLLDAVARSGATRLYAIPAVWHRILDADRSRFDLSSLEELDTGTSATPPELVAALKDAFPGTQTRVFYGSTEAGPGTVLLEPDLERKPGSVGLPAAGVEVRLADDGEVLLRSPYLMSGYLDDPVASTAALAGGWYHTGDLGWLDDEGFLSIVGRIRDVIRTGGETVAPGEVEDVVAMHPAVEEAAVVGLPDPEWGEIVTAAVVVKGGRDLDLEDLQVHCSAHLAPFKVPRRLEVVDRLPRTAATGQIQRPLLVERLGARP